MRVIPVVAMCLIVISIPRSAMAAQFENHCDSGHASFDRILPKGQNSFDCLHLTNSENTYLISWTTRQNVEPSSHIRLLRIDGQSFQTLQRIDLLGGYDTKLSEENLGSASNAPVVFMVTNYGAIAAEVRAANYKANRIHVIFSALGDKIEFVHLSDSALEISVHNRVNALDVPELYEMNQDRFVRCDSKYPRYYRTILQAQQLSEASEVAPSLIPRLAHLLILSGDSDGARRLIQRVPHPVAR
jgi:hypothetical protein